MKSRARKIILLTLLVLSFFAAFWPGTDGKAGEMDVVAGMSAHQIARILRDKNLIVSKVPFLLWVKARQAGSKIHVGRYEIPMGRSAFWIVDDMIYGRTKKSKVTIPEGFSSWQIAQRLEALGLGDAEVIKKAIRDNQLEGFLYPATYDIDYGLTATDLLRIFQSEFERRWTGELDRRARERKWTKKEAVTMASILEREARVPEELPLISAVYHNRLKKRMKLEADPTVQYGMGYWKKRLLYEDYRNTKSPYNTYLHLGLPPGPICSPGSKAISAALNPAQSTALYFVARENGTHDFSRTFREHTRKVRERNRTRRLNKKN